MRLMAHLTSRAAIGAALICLVIAGATVNDDIPFYLRGRKTTGKMIRLDYGFGRTHRIQYRFTDHLGQEHIITQTIDFLPEAGDKHGEPIRVVYLPENPTRARPAKGRGSLAVWLLVFAGLALVWKPVARLLQVTGVVSVPRGLLDQW